MVGPSERAGHAWSVPWVPPGTQAPNGSQRTVNGRLTANGRIRPLTVNRHGNLV